MKKEGGGGGGGVKRSKENVSKIIPKNLLLAQKIVPRNKFQIIRRKNVNEEKKVEK